MKKQGQIWSPENTTFQTITRCTRGHLTTEIPGGVSHESHERIDCEKFPLIDIHFNDDRHSISENVSVELLINVQLALSPITHVRMHGTFEKQTKRQIEKKECTFKVTAFEEMRDGSVIGTFVAPDEKHKTAP